MTFFRYFALFFTAIFLVFLSCTGKKSESRPASTPAPFEKGSFGYDIEFLRKYNADLVLLQSADGKAQIAVAPAYQGRVMTSTASGPGGTSFGWINYELIASQKNAPHINATGGEERFWIGPEGGQYSIFFKKGVPFTFDNWFVPKEIDIEPFQLSSHSAGEAHFEKTMRLENYAGTVFDLQVKRTIRLLERAALDSLLGVALPASVESVGFESVNTLKNTGSAAWEKKSGLLSIWILSMLNATPATTVAIPYRQGDEKALGKIVTDNYFGKVPADRLHAANGLILFKADGQKRSKIGVAPTRALPVAAAWDAASGVLTIAQFSLPADATDYVNSLWEQQKEPFRGDAVNAYNDGPNDTGKQLGTFYELESSSPAAALRAGESLTHWHRTVHLKGAAADLEGVARKLLGVGLDALRL